MPFPRMPSSLPLLVLTLAGLTAQPLPAQPTTESASQPAEVKYEVESRRIIPLPDGTGRQMIVERITPPVLPPAAPVAKPIPVDPAVRAARRAAWALEAKKERRLVSVTGIQYPNGQTFLSWFMPAGPGLEWQQYEAWTLTDFRAAWLVREFEVGNTLYDIFPSVHQASRWDLRRPFPGPLYFPPGSPGFRLIKGDPSHTGPMEFMTALHQIFREEGPQLTSRWLSLRTAQEAEAARLKANPPPLRNRTIRYWPIQGTLTDRATGTTHSPVRKITPALPPRAVAAPR